MDITHDGFGFMLCFGDLAWVPFTYCLQTRYLVENDGLRLVLSQTRGEVVLSSEHIVFGAALVLSCLGFWIFRRANSEKDAFRRDPKALLKRNPKLRTFTTNSGRQLLISGWWGLARKINYTGDWLLGVSWCLYCGLPTTSRPLVPYFYAVYFFVLLVHRAFRDDAQCARKYGKDWDRYKLLVPSLFVPGVI